jgi:hypothetical protein
VIRIISVSGHTINEAVESPMDDFEDAVQALAAISEGIEVVVTRDKTSFINSGLQVFTPQTFLDYLENQ